MVAQTAGKKVAMSAVHSVDSLVGEKAGSLVEMTAAHLVDTRVESSVDYLDNCLAVLMAALSAVYSELSLVDWMAERKVGSSVSPRAAA